jgi:iron complex outermembrane receptor protein
VRTPSRIEQGFKFDFLAVPSLPLFLRLIGDGNFDPEEMIGYEAGWRVRATGTWLLGINAYYNHYDDLLSVENRPAAVETTPAPTHLVLPLFLRNGIEGNTKGFEVSSVWDPISAWRLRGSYSYLHLNVRRQPTSNDASSVMQEEGDSPSHKLVLQSAWNVRRWELNLTYRYVSAIPDQRVKAYSTADARLAWRIRPQIELAVTGQNLLQPNRFEYGGDPGPLIGIKRAVYGQITWRSSDTH